MEVLGKRGLGFGEAGRVMQGGWGHDRHPPPGSQSAFLPGTTISLPLVPAQTALGNSSPAKSPLPRLVWIPALEVMDCSIAHSLSLNP